MLRQRLCESANVRFARDGFDATTIEDITRDAGVSRRTFFRHFESKEDIVLSQLEDTGAIVYEALSKRPAAESPLLAMRNCFKALDEQALGERCRRLLLGELIDKTTSLRALMLLRQQAWEEEIARRLAQRMGLPADDRLASLLATLGFAAFRLASRDSRLSGALTLADAIDQNFDRLAGIGRSA